MPSTMNTGLNKTSPLTQARPARTKISLVTACRNHADTIEACLNSVQIQTHGQVEHMVVDGRGQDGTLDRVLNHPHDATLVRGSRSDNRFAAWNEGLRCAQGEVIGFLNPTDTLADSTVLSRVAEAFQNPWVSAVYGDLQQSGRLDKRTDQDRIKRNGALTEQRLRSGWTPPIAALFVRRRWYLRVGGFSPELALAADYQAALRLFAYPGFQALYLPGPMVKLGLVRPDPSSVARLWLQPAQELRALSSVGRTGIGALGTVLARSLGQPFRRS